MSRASGCDSCGLRARVWLRDMRTLFHWMGSHAMWEKFFGWSLSIFALLYLFSLRERTPDDPRWDPALVTARDRTDAMLVPLSLALFVHSKAVFASVLFECAPRATRAHSD